MDTLVKTIKLLADRNRLRIIKLLERRKMCVCELAHVIGITQPSVSRHLKKLKEMRLVDCEQDGLWSNYSLKLRDAESKRILALVCGYLEHEAVCRGDIARSGAADRRALCCKKGCV